MTVYRLGKTKYARDVTGEGARLNGGRWNHIGTPCIYTSATKSLALLEYSVNVNIEDIPRALSFTAIDIPHNKIKEFPIAALPGDWNSFPAPASARDFGTALIKKARVLVLKIPSVVIPGEWNYIINPSHADRKKIRILSIDDFVYDIRIKII